MRKQVFGQSECACPNLRIASYESGCVAITANSVIGLHPLLIRKGNAGIFYVTKWGGHSQIATRGAGISAIKALKSKKTVGEVEQLLAPISSTVSLRPLLNALLSANLVRTVDGVAVSELDFRFLILVKSLCRNYIIPACSGLMKRLPIRLHRWGLYALTYLNSYRSLRQRAKRAEENIRKTPLRVQKQFSTRYLHHLLVNIADTNAVFAARPIEARRWLDEATVWDGSEYIEQARSLGKGIIFAGFHFSASRLVAPLLLTRGLNVYMTATPSPSVNMTAGSSWHRDFCSSNPDAGRFQQIPQINLAAVKLLLEALSRNDVILTFPDMHTINTDSDDATRTRCAFFGINSRPFKTPTITVGVAGVEAEMNEWAGWLASHSDAPVVPVSLVRLKSGRFVLRFSAPIVCPASEDPGVRGAIVNRELFQTLDGYVRAYPSQWFGWHRFHLQRLTE